MTTETVVQPASDAELFRGAMADPPPQQEQTPAPAQTAPEATPTTEPAAQPRDERGRWATNKPEPTSEPSAPAAATQQQLDPAQAAPQPAQPGSEEGPVPSWRHRELREQRDASEARNRQLEAHLMDQARQLRALQDFVQKQQQPAPQVPDMIVDPAAYHQHMQSTFDDRLRNMEANFSFRLAHQVHGETFERAYTDMIGRAERGDPSVVQAIMRSPDPGAAMVNWYRRERTLSQVGDDPDKWSDARQAERLKSDRKYRGELLEQIRQLEQAAPNNGNSGPNVQLPPSLNSVASSAPNVLANSDMSDASLFNHAFRAR